MFNSLFLPPEYEIQYPGDFTFNSIKIKLNVSLIEKVFEQKVGIEI